MVIFLMKVAERHRNFRSLDTLAQTEHKYAMFKKTRLA